MTRFSDELKAEIKARVRLSDLVGRTVSLKRRGKDYVGKSPFADEKTPSFYVHDDRAFYKCFSTQKSGDCFTWLMETQGLSFPDAVKQLADELGIEVETASPAQAKASQRRARILQCLAWAQEFYCRALSLSSKAHHARTYVSSRQLYPLNRDIDAAGIGWAPGSSTYFFQVAEDAGWSLDDLLAAGLAKVRDDGQRQAVFRDRVTLPVHDLQGRVIAFTARALSAEAIPKYLNSPETEVYTKGAAMFGLHAARVMLAKGLPLHVVEGCFDAERLRVSGMAACAPLGTALTVAQLELAWRFVDSPVLCFDGDAAGKRAAHLAARRALPALRGARGLRFCMLPEGEDPDTLLLKGGQLPAPVSHFAVVWDALTTGLNLGDPSDRMRVRTKAGELLREFTDDASRIEWRRALGIKFAETNLRATPKPRDTGPPDSRAPRVSREAKAQGAWALPEPDATVGVLLATLLHDPTRVEAHLETLAALPSTTFDAVRLVLMDGEPTGKEFLAADELVKRLTRAGILPVGYSAEGWERAARQVIAHHGAA